MDNLADKTAVQLDLIDQEVKLKAESYKKIIAMANTLYYKRGVLEQIARTNEAINRRLLKSMFWNTILISISLSLLISLLVIFFKVLFLAYDLKISGFFILGGICIYVLVNCQILPSFKKIKQIIIERKSFKIQESLAEKRINADQDFVEFKKQIIAYNKSLLEIADQMKAIWIVIKGLLHSATLADLNKVHILANQFPEITNEYLELAINIDEIVNRVSVESSVDFETIVYRGVAGSQKEADQKVHILDVLECEKAILVLRERRHSKN